MMELRPLEPRDLAAAAGMLSARTQRQRTVFPELPADGEDLVTAQLWLSQALSRPGVAGWGAFEAGSLSAYLIGEQDLAPIWDRSGWFQPIGSGWGDAPGLACLADLYALAAADWVRNGIFAHFALVPANEADAHRLWFELSFGVEHVHAVLDLRTAQLPASPLPDGVSVRLATAEDEAALGAMSDTVWRLQSRAPVWGVMLPENIQGNRDGWIELLHDPVTDVWLAFQAGELVGTQAYYPSELTGERLLGGASTCHLAIAGTRDGFRGRGIASSLTCAGLAHARERGYHFCETDWRSTNLLSSRFWPRFGFRPAFFRLTRRIDSRIAWAGGDR